MTGTTPAPSLVGRDGELARLREFLPETPEGPAALVLVGEPGIGKTTLWQQPAFYAGEEGWTVLSARPAEAERTMAFAVLGDLLRDQQDRLNVLPQPQRRALEAALLGVAEAPTPPSPQAMGLGLLRLLDHLSADQPLLLAVDDAQWIDGSSAIVLSFAMRRLGSMRVRILMTTRPDSVETVTREFGLDHWPSQLVKMLPVGSLSRGALDRLVSEALGIRLPGSILRRLEQLTHGNPYHALQVAPILAEAPAADPWSLPVPDTPAAAILARLARLPPTVAHGLRVFSAASPQTLRLIRETGPAALRRSLEGAIRAGILRVTSDRPEFSHPLIPSVVYGALSASERKAVHRRLAALAADPSERARHRALASAGPHESVAVELVTAAEGEQARGAPEAAGALLELAARMSPSAGDRHRRLIAAGEAYEGVGLVGRARDLFGEVLDHSTGPERSRARIRLATLPNVHTAETVRQLTAVLSDDSLDPGIRADAYLSRATRKFSAGDVDGAVWDSEAALASAKEAGNVDAIVRAAVDLAWGRTYSRPPEADDLALAQELSMQAEYLDYGTHPHFVIALRSMYRDRLPEARAGLDGLIALAEQRRDDFSLSGYHFHAAEVEIRAGQFAAAQEHAQMSLDIARAIGDDQGLSVGSFVAGLSAAHAGRTDDARTFAAEGLAVAEALGDWIFRVQNATVFGFADLSDGAVDAAAARIGGMPEELLSHGFREPSVIPVWPNAIEALLLAGDIARAARLVPTYLELAEEFDCPWARATGRRCHGLLLAARGDLPKAEEIFRQAADTHVDLVSPFERARTQLALGSVLRRQRLRREAREILNGARQTFESLGAIGWAEHARQEEARIRGRQSDLPGLSVTELSVARLVAEGHTNREVAAALFMAERTVEANLSRIYSKLGMRSRTELTRWMSEQAQSAGRSGAS